MEFGYFDERIREVATVLTTEWAFISKFTSFFFLLLFLSSMSLFLFNIGRFQWSIWRYMYNSKMIDKYGWIADKKAESPKNKSQTKGHFETSVNLSLPLSFFPSMHLSFLPAWVKIQIHVSHNCSCLSYQMQIYHTRHKIKKTNFTT